MGATELTIIICFSKISSKCCSFQTVLLDWQELVLLST